MPKMGKNNLNNGKAVKPGFFKKNGYYAIILLSIMLLIFIGNPQLSTIQAQGTAPAAPAVAPAAPVNVAAPAVAPEAQNALGVPAEVKKSAHKK
ncbi:MAG TPA: hypothetical protein PKK26_16930, partial [Candidatus Wallbacteria bacterium]|nr:hypothetical protein [Candidatus Wallbacteria bacterium]